MEGSLLLIQTSKEVKDLNNRDSGLTTVTTVASRERAEQDQQNNEKRVKHLRQYNRTSRRIRKEEAPIKILAWDIETAPLVTYEWSLSNQYTSSDKVIKPPEMMSFASSWLGEKDVDFWSTYHNGKQEMLDAAHRLLNEADAVLSWNGKSFDTKHVNREFLQVGMNPPSPYKEIDLMAAVKKRFKFASNKLQYVCEQLDLEGKHKTDWDLWIACMAGDSKAWAKMRRYNKRDVVLLEQLYARLLPWIPGHPNVALWSEDLNRRCTRCGSPDVQEEDGKSTKTAAGEFALYQCVTCGSWSKEAKRISTTPLREASG